ncbi:hypothetical protein AMATHDRAFT_71126 [Amanita thiersii Skay4041]|uniref:PH domain-containing protein n=1 Tax=Amanita thiersii Skay4041 TaxID=703135 RepID=A0A2A9N950_9AGAR|nr:hypothetical protein AMATHDRAFT_71126 [Amanita thiersii Skay4041]
MALDVHQTQHAIYREDLRVGSKCIMINYIPFTISSVERAHALVNARQLEGLFQECKGSITTYQLSTLTPKLVREALLKTNNIRHIARSSSNQVDNHDYAELEEIKRTASDGYFRNIREPDLSPDIPQGNIATNIPSDDPPPPIPPKDGDRNYAVALRSHLSTVPRSFLPMQTTIQDDNYGAHCTVSHTQLPDDQLCRAKPEVLVSSYRDPHFPYLPLRGKWANATILDSTERARLQLQARLERQREEAEAMKEEERRQAEIKRVKETLMAQVLEDEARRRHKLEKEFERAATERQRRERIQTAEEEQERRLMELKRRIDKERRLEQYRKMEEWYKEQMKLEQETLRQTNELKTQQTEEHIMRLRRMQNQLEKNASDVTGWVTIQTNESIAWKRRFFRVAEHTMYLYRSAKDAHQIMDVVQLKEEVQDVKEWGDGYEELRAIPYSFAVEFKQSGKTWMMFADTEHDKYKILALIFTGAGW